MKEIVIEYLLKHGDELKCKIDKTALMCYNKDSFIDQVINIISLALNLTYEQVAEILTEENLERIFGKDWLESGFSKVDGSFL